MKKNVRIYNRRVLTDIPAFKYYRENAKHRDIKRTWRREKYSHLVIKFWEKVGEKLIENPNGVFLRNFGYFTILMNPKREVIEWNYQKMLINPHTDGRIYQPIFLPITKQSSIQSFIMDKAFVKPLKHKLSKELKKGKKYYNHFGVLYSMFKNKK